MWLFLLGLFCGVVLGIVILALLIGSRINDTDDLFAKNESYNDENDTPNK